MKAQDLVNLHGREYIEKWLELQIGSTPVYKKYVCLDGEGNITGVSNSGELSVQSLKTFMDKPYEMEFIQTNRYRTEKVVGRVGKKFISVGTTRFTKDDRIREGFPVATHRDAGGWCISHLHRIDSDFAKKFLHDSEVVRVRRLLNEHISNMSLGKMNQLLEVLNEG